MKIVRVALLTGLLPLASALAAPGPLRAQCQAFRGDLKRIDIVSMGSASYAVNVRQAGGLVRYVTTGSDPLVNLGIVTGNVSDLRGVRLRLVEVSDRNGPQTFLILRDAVFKGGNLEATLLPADPGLPHLAVEPARPNSLMNCEPGLAASLYSRVQGTPAGLLPPLESAMALRQDAVLQELLTHPDLPRVPSFRLPRFTTVHASDRPTQIGKLQPGNARNAFVDLEIEVFLGNGEFQPELRCDLHIRVETVEANRLGRRPPIEVVLDRTNETHGLLTRAQLIAVNGCRSTLPNR